MHHHRIWYFPVMGVRRGGCMFQKKGADIKKGGMKKKRGADIPFRTMIEVCTIYLCWGDILKRPK